MIDPFAARETLTEMAGPVMAALSQALLRICPSLKETNVHLVILSIVGQLIHTVCAREMFEESTYPGLPRIDLEEMVDHVVRFSAAGIRGYARGAGEQE
jgi:hypothetical protein